MNTLSNPVRQPKVTGIVGGQNLPINEASITLVAGANSTCNVKMQKRQDATGSGGKAVDALAFDVAKDIAAMQTQIFAQKTDPDSTVTVDDGQGNTLVFRGYMTSPNYSNATGAYGFSYNIAHESVLLSAYRPFIYVFPLQTRQNVYNEVFDFTSASMTKRFMEVLDYQIKGWQDRGRATGDGSNDTPITKELTEAWDKQNQTVYPHLKKVFDASDGASTWDSLGTDIPSSADHDLISSYISGILSQRGNNFFASMGAFEQSFLCQFVPTFGATTDGFGKFIRWKDIAFGTAKDLTIPSLMLNVSAGNRQFLVTTHVFIEGAIASVFRDTAGLGQGTIPAPIVSVWPTLPYLGGQILNNSGPPWLSGVTPSQQIVDKAYNTQQGLDLLNYQSGVKKLSDFLGEVTDKFKQPILDQWAQVLYAFSSLENSTCEIPIPLDVSIMPGKRYNIKNGSGQTLFSGFLAQVSHSVVSAPRQGNGSSILKFTHMIATGFTLPGGTS